jgi:gas vesicle protein
MSLSINTLLNGFGNTSSNSSYTSGLYSSLSEYSTIRTGAYKKLLNSYYSKTQSTKASQTGTNYQVKGNSTVEKKQLTEVKDAADSLYSSAAKLTDTSSTKSLFKNAQSVTGEISSAVKNFVNDYNSLVEEAADTSNSKVTGKVSFMTRQTNAYKSSLENIGITINDDKTLTVDEKKLNSADVNDVKKLFNGSSSMAYQTFVRASSISSAAENASTTSGLYGSDGAYDNYYNSAYNWYL